MKKLYTLIFLLVSTFVFAKDVDVNYAMRVAKHFYMQNSTASEAVTLKLVYECRTPKNVGAAIDDKPIYYVFDVNGLNSFVMVSAEDLVTPILGYSTESYFPINNVNQEAQKWFENYKAQIIYVKENVHSTTEEITAKWKNYYENIPVIQSAGRGIQAVNPLCQTKWNQAPNENGACPYSNLYNERCVTGCVATAMAQIMKFWNYPTQGVGSHSYNDQNFGTQAANFGATTYNWAGMGNTLSSPNSDVATLMYHCGVAVEMSYGVGATGGSSAFVVASLSPGQACAEYAYKTYFGYDPNSLQGVSRDNYTDANWISLLKGELDAGRPIQYAGFGQGGGHTWVCDGYDQNNFFHQNWGWGGNSDGFFSVNNLDPTSLGAGGGTGGFNSRQQAVIGIKPANGGGGGGGTINQGGIALYAATTVSANPVQSGSSFSVYADIANSGSTNFTGNFAAAIFDHNGVFVRIIQEYTNQTAQAGYHYQVSFTDNNLDVIPGTYYLGIYYKNSTFDYSLINQNTFNNPVTFTVTGPANNIQMAGNTTLNPTAFTKGQAASVQAQIGNAGSGNWTGWISADLYKLDGTWVATFDEVQGSMNAQTAYNVTFNNSNLSVDPGSYLLAFFSTTNQQNYTLVYSQSFPNPVDVNVITPGLQPDQYEANNSEGASYGFNPSFNGNTASVQTTGSNMHIGSDYDYYTINLPSGTNYAITARVHDSNNSGNGQAYSNDVQFSYKVNGGSWSGTYDDVMGSQIGVQGGGTVTFFVADYFQGTVGSYLLDLQISRGANVGINEVSKDEISVYPNPASNKLFVNTTQNDGDYTLKIFNTTGAQVFEKNSAFNSNKIEVDISTLAQGIYNLQLQGKSGISNTKFTVK
ncbi:MAG: hypothetical protein BGO32_08105 [Bacteroidetes bacterium 37-13]|nr:MAG: hypothetical protein BGO32_08105 [Bacteroidetes bacterium 37-13]